jgi:hypothetical protein
MIAAMLVFAAATILIDGEFIPNAVGWALTATAIVLMLVTFRAYVAFLRQADELLRKVHLDALALAFGVGAVVMMGYRLCERLGAPDLDINDPFLVMMLVWIGAQFIGARRYAGGESDE